MECHNYNCKAKQFEILYKKIIHIEKQQTRLAGNHNAGEEATSVHIMHPFVVVVVAVDLTCFEAIIKRKKLSLMLGFGHNHFSQHNLKFMQAECWPQFHLYGCEIHGTCYMLYSLPISSALIRTMITSINAVSKKKIGKNWNKTRPESRRKSTSDA